MKKILLLLVIATILGLIGWQVEDRNPLPDRNTPTHSQSPIQLPVIKKVFLPIVSR